MDLSSSPLGQKTEYIYKYDPTLLFAIERCAKRKDLGLNPDKLPFYGVDIWNAYEISWLDNLGKPYVCLAQIDIDAHSLNIVESKSLKLYFNSFNNTKFSSPDEVAIIMQMDIAEVVKGNVSLKFIPIDSQIFFSKIPGVNIDNLNISCDSYTGADNSILECTREITREIISSNLLRSNCPVTNQPDWGSVLVEYKGHRIDHSSLLRYIVSFRNYQDFHEQCAEKIFFDLYNLISPSYLSVYIRYTRRGGIDISPYRTMQKHLRKPSNDRLVRQ